MNIVIERRFEPEDVAQRFHLLPVEIPGGVRRMRVGYTYNDRVDSDAPLQGRAGNVVDIGLVGPGGTRFLKADFKGWSGSARQSFTLEAGAATPGYLAGPILPGVWHVLLGLYQVAPQGCDVRVTVTLDPPDAADALPLPLPGHVPPPVPGPRWFCGDLHCHSHHSEASGSLADLAAAARARGLDFLAVTEHNTVSHLPHLAAHGGPDLLLVPGAELTTYRGHANVFGLDRPLELRCDDDEAMRRVREDARRRGWLFSINHPKDGGPPWTYGECFEPDCVEVWQAPWWLSNYQSLALWDGLLRQGRRVTALGGSDKHQGPFTGELGWYELGTPTTWVYADELSVSGLLGALRAGRTCVSAGPEGPRLELAVEVAGRRFGIGDVLAVEPGQLLAVRCRVTGGAGGVLRLLGTVLEDRGPAGMLDVDDDEQVQEWEVRASGPGYLRVELIEPPEADLAEEPDALMVRALTGALYVVGMA